MSNYGTLRPIKQSRKHKKKPSYVSFRTGEQGWNFPRPSWNPTSLQLKALAILFVVVAGIFASDQVAKVMFPNSPYNPLSNYDPFTLLWNGTSPAVMGSGSGPIVFNSKVNASLSGMSVVLPGLAVSSADTIVVTMVGPNAFDFGCSVASAIAISDSQTNSYTLRVQSPDVVGGGANTCIYTAPASATATDTITVSTAPHNEVWRIAALDYSGSIGFGNTGTDERTVSPTGTSTLTMTIASTSSVIVEAFDIDTPGSVTVTETSGQTVRNFFTTGAPTAQDVEISTDVSGFSGSSSISLSWTISGTPCTNPNFCRISHSGLELKSVPSISACAIGYNCIISGTDASGNIKLNANSTTAAVTLTKAPIDVSTSSAKELLFYETWRNSTNLSVAQPWGWYLTTNSTLPTQAKYFPLNDTNIVLANLVYPNAGDTSKNYYEYMAKTGASQSLLATSGAGTNPFPSCPQSSTLYLCAGSQTSSGTQFLGISTTLNYTGNAGNTGNNGFSLLCVDSTPTQAPPTTNYCSSATQTPTVSPCTGSSQEVCATTTLPFLNMQSGPFYLGFWSGAGQSATILFGSSSTGVAAQRANSVWYWVPNPTTATPSTVDTGGFFGPVIKALLGIGVWIVANIVSFITFLTTVIAPFLAAVFSVLVNVLQGELNALGGFFGWGNIGDQFISFASGIITYFTVGLSDALLWLVRLISRGIDLIKLANFWVGFYLTGVLNVLADALNVIQEIVIFGNKIVTFLGSSYVFLLVIVFLWYDADMGIAGWHAWFETVKWLTFISFDFLERMINFGISSVTWIIGRIPTMDGTTLPELPTIAIGGGPIWPSMEMTSLREGNVFALFGQLIGVAFLFWYETSGLPGSIGANVPAAPVNSLNPFINMFLILIAIMGLVFVLSIPAQLMRKTFDLDATEPASIGGRIRQGVIATGSVSGKIVRKHPERKFHIQINRGLGRAGLRPHLRKLTISPERAAAAERVQRAVNQARAAEQVQRAVNQAAMRKAQKVQFQGSSQGVG